MGMLKSPDGPRIDADILELREQAAAAQRFLKASIGLDQRFNIQDLLDGKHRPRVRSEVLGDNLGAAEIHQTLPHTHDAMLIDMETRDAWRRVFRVVVAHHVLGGLVDIDGLDPQIRAPLEVILENARDLCDLTRRERIKRMVATAAPAPFREASSVFKGIWSFLSRMIRPATWGARLDQPYPKSVPDFSSGGEGASASLRSGRRVPPSANAV